MFRAVPYHKKYHRQVIDLLGLLWSNWSYELREKVFHWKYSENPYCSEPQFFLMLEGEKVVALRGFFVNAYLVKGKVVYAGIPADSVTHPDYRRQGIFEALTSFAMQSNADKNFPEFYLSLSSNPLAAKGHQKAGFKNLGNWNELYRFSAYPFIPLRFKRDVAGSIHKSWQFEIEVSRTLDPIEIAGYFSQEEKNGFHLLKDKRFFSWRYQQPAFSYVFLDVKRDNERVGWASFAPISKGRALMTDFRFTDSKAIETGLAYFSRTMGIWALQTRVFSKSPDVILKLKGLKFRNFKSLLKWAGMAEAEPILVRPAIINTGSDQWTLYNVCLTDSQNWNLYLIDSDGA